MPNESKQKKMLLENEENDTKNEISGDYCRDKKSSIGENDDINCDECVESNRIAEINAKENNQCPFEMIDNITKTMKRLENIVVDYYSDSDESEKLSERQQQRLKILQKKREEKAQKEGISEMKS